MIVKPGKIKNRIAKYFTQIYSRIIGLSKEY
jgi:ribosomal protein S17E